MLLADGATEDMQMVVEEHLQQVVVEETLQVVVQETYACRWWDSKVFTLHRTVCTAVIDG